jgi:hypothetical protein
MQEGKVLNASYFPRNEKTLDSNWKNGYSLHNGLISNKIYATTMQYKQL